MRLVNVQAPINVVNPSCDWCTCKQKVQGRAETNWRFLSRCSSALAIRILRSRTHTKRCCDALSSAAARRLFEIECLIFRTQGQSKLNNKPYSLFMKYTWLNTSTSLSRYKQNETRTKRNYQQKRNELLLYNSTISNIVPRIARRPIRGRNVIRNLAIGTKLKNNKNNSCE